MLVKEPILYGIENQRYIVKIAESDSELLSAYKLRYDVFFSELNRNFNFKNGMDRDAYDAQCHHLVVIHKEKNQVIGTYRLQTYEQAQNGLGYNTREIYKIEQFPDEVLKNAFEVGRACIHPDHRNGRVLYLLWKGIAGYLEYFKLRYLFGYSAINTLNPAIAMNTYRYLAENGYMHQNYFIDVKSHYRCPDVNGTDGVDIPQLFKNYLDVGTKVCSLPAYVQKNNVINFLILLDIEQISKRTRKLFFG